MELLGIISWTRTSAQVLCEHARTSLRYFRKVIMFSKSDSIFEK
jgi:hypothetical protein